MKRLRTLLDHLLGGILALLMAAMVLNVLWQVFTRFVLRTPSGHTEELARYLMIWTGLLGAAHAGGRHGHLALDLLSARASGSARACWQRILHGLTFVFALGVMTGGGGRLVHIQWQLGQLSPALQLNMGLIYLAIPAAGLCMAFYSLCDLVLPGEVRQAEEPATGNDEGKIAP